jgi:hypothetical protein
MSVRNIASWASAYAWTALWIAVMLGVMALDAITPTAWRGRIQWRAFGWFLRQTKRYCMTMRHIQTVATPIE